MNVPSSAWSLCWVLGAYVAAAAINNGVAAAASGDLSGSRTTDNGVQAPPRPRQNSAIKLLFSGHDEKEKILLRDAERTTTPFDASTTNISLTTPVFQTRCGHYHDLNSSEAKCAFIKSQKECANDDGFINYLQVIYCVFPDLRVLGFILLALWLVYLIIALGVTAEEFFCPNLDVMSRTLKMSQNIAGVTLLAFGNGAPDIFSAIAAVTNARNGEAGLAIGALFGAGIFVTTIVAGSIAITRPFKMVERPFLRDSIFYLAAAFWTFYILYKGNILLQEAVGYIALYGLYVVVVFVGRKIYQKHRRRMQPQEVTTNGASPKAIISVPVPDVLGVDGSASTLLQEPSHFHGTRINSAHGVPSINSHGSDMVTVDYGTLANLHERGHLTVTERLAVASMLGVDGNIARSLTPRSLNAQSDDEGEDAPLLGRENGETRTSQMKEFFIGICPIDIKEWSEKKWYSKVWEIIKSPLIFLLTITIPVVDYNEPKNRWNRMLNVLNLLLAPTFCTFVTKGLTKPITGGFLVWHLVLAISVLLAALVFFTSKPEKHPVYHSAFSYIGFVVAVLWIYSLANEIVNILQMFGIEFNIDDAVLGLTVLAWGNSIGDLIADITMAKQGFPTMGMSACFGGPMFNMLLGIGISCTITTIRDKGSFKLVTNDVQYVLAAGLAVSLLSSMILMVVMRFRANRFYGIYLYCLYAVVLIVASLVLRGVIKL
ncbi:mitochondrial sodium/calcium exchanger protein-like [Diadema setosum]|uniref:mitochondrial sodium/calcium exchanger protein-like n=1 Tax=Diadema setosum TaxID=31175 RepID=UPI003B3A8005